MSQISVVISKNKKSSTPMGALVLYIALLLVAAIVAAVVISSSQTVTNKARITSTKTNQEVGTSIIIVDSWAKDGTDGSVDYFDTKAKVIAGSEPLELATTLVYFSLKNVSGTYTYNGSINCSLTTDLDGNPTHYGSFFNFANLNYLQGFINRGDVVTLCLKSPRTVEQYEEIRLAIVPMYGKSWEIKSRMPYYMSEPLISVFP